MRFGWMIACTLGCGMKDPSADWEDCEDTAAGACDTGQWDHADNDHDGGATDGASVGGEETGGEETGGEETGGDDGGPSAVSCSFSADICVEPNEADNDAWCSGLGGTPSADACADGADGTCVIPAGGDYTADATAYYYNGFDGASACEGAGGTYTAASGSDEAGDDSHDTGW